ncbi:unnamed protein product [Brassica rapa]|uniref:Uncharacterized protein n=1 Tax=Brassica campestris TaxID=3711 RepID=A0A8D9GAN9_BRACM|nr:unnamed protein product [Brassica rapa]
MTHPKTARRAPQRNAHTNNSNSSSATHPQHPNQAIIRPGNGLYTTPNRAKWTATSAIPNQSPNLHTTAPHTTTRGSSKPMKCWDVSEDQAFDAAIKDTRTTTRPKTYASRPLSSSTNPPACSTPQPAAMVIGPTSIHPGERKRTQTRRTIENLEHPLEPNDFLDQKQQATAEPEKPHRPSHLRIERSQTIFKGRKSISNHNPKIRLQQLPIAHPSRRNHRERGEASGEETPLQQSTPRHQTLAHDTAHIEGEQTGEAAAKRENLD